MIGTKVRVGTYKYRLNQQTLTKSDVEGIMVLKPQNTNLLSPFNEILIQIEHNKKENQELTALRDFLLPLLMNGQVGFKEN